MLENQTSNPELEIKEKPKQPVPSAVSTLKRYRDILEQFYGELGFRADKGVTLFLEVAKLANPLIEKEQANPFAKAWEEYCLEKNSSYPGLCFPLVKEEGLEPKSSVSERAAALIESLVKVSSAVKSEESLYPDMDADTVFDFYRIFSQFRKPGRLKDNLKQKKSIAEIAIFVDGLPYMLSLVNDNGERKGKTDILNDINAITNSKKAALTTNKIGLETSGMNRREWYKEYSQLDESITTRLDSALFVVDLDNTNNDSLSQKEKTNDLLNQMRNPNQNRWPNAGLHLIVSQSNTSMLFEHASCDGSTAAEFFDLVIENADYEKNEPQQSGNYDNGSTTINEAQETTSLLFHTPIDISKIKNIKRYREITKSIHPDSFFQVALAIAIKDTFGKHLPVLEPINTRNFAGGRLEIMPTMTSGLATLAKLLEGDSSATTDKDKQIAFRIASEQHLDRVKGVKEGVDQLLIHIQALSKALSTTIPSAKLENFFGLISSEIRDTIAAPVIASNGGTRKHMDAFGTMNSRRADVTNDDATLAIGYMIHKDKFVVDVTATGQYRNQIHELKSNLDLRLNYFLNLFNNI